MIVTTGAALAAPAMATGAPAALTESERARLVQSLGASASEPWQQSVVRGLVADPDAGSVDAPQGVPSDARSSARWRRLYDDCPSGRDGMAMAFDPVHRRFLMFGGLDGGIASDELWELSLRPRIRWRMLTAEGGPPTGRANAAAAFDPQHQRLIITCGNTSRGMLEDTWVLDLSGSPRWTQLVPEGPRPYLIMGAAAIWDAPRSRMVVFGGEDAVLRRNEVWAVEIGDRARWTLLTHASTSTLHVTMQTTVYDRAGDQAILFGGVRGWTEPAGATLALSLSGGRWDRVAAQNEPPYRWQHAAAWDEESRTMIVCGGLDPTNSLYSDTWLMKLTPSPTWSRVATVGRVMPARFGHALTVDPLHHQVLLFGGTDGSQLVPGLLSLDLRVPSQWVALGVSGIQPPLRSFHTLVHDPIRHQMILFGGWSASGLRNDVWTMSLIDYPPQWRLATPAGTPPDRRYGHAAVYDQAGDRMIVIGGNGGDRLLNDVWSLSLSGQMRWERLEPSGFVPLGRWMHTAVYDSLRRRVIITGGSEISSPTSASGYSYVLWLDPQPRWELLRTQDGQPCGREYASFVRIPGQDRAVLHGGHDFGGALNDTWLFDLSSDTWGSGSPISTSGPARYGAVAGYDAVHRRMLMVGGRGDSAVVGDAWQFDVGASRWTRLDGVGGAELERQFAGGDFDAAAGQLVLFGGRYADHDDGAFGDSRTLRFNQVAALSERARDGARVLIPDAPQPGHVSDFVMVFDEHRNRLILYDTARQRLFSFRESDSPRWQLLQAAGPYPSAQGGLAAVYDERGHRAVLWDGEHARVWALRLDGSLRWEELHPAGGAPEPRSHGLVAYDAREQRMLLHGGLKPDDFGFGDVWALDLGEKPTWARIDAGAPGPRPRGRHVGVWDPNARRFVIGFGWEDIDYLSDVWALHLPDALWESLPKLGEAPATLRDAAACYDARGRRMLVVGGGESPWGMTVDTTWALDLAGQPTWSVLRTDETPPGRSGHALAMDQGRRRVFMYGGRSIGGPSGNTLQLADLWEMSFVPRLPRDAVAATPPRPIAFSFDGAYPNPTRGALRLAFDLPTSDATTLMIYDVAGRKMVEEPLGTLGPGSFARDIPGATRLRPGLYFICLRHGIREAMKRIVIAR
jgi:hypothetical protein